MYFQYFKYLVRHKWYVFLECRKMGMWWRGLVHDLSKFLPSEFIPYAHFYYGKHGIKFNGGMAWEHAEHHKVRDDYHHAWLLHAHRNPHHWEYWVLPEGKGNHIILDMPYVFRQEMLADWRGAGMAKHGYDDTCSFFKERVDAMLLHPHVKKFMENKLFGGNYANNHS